MEDFKVDISFPRKPDADPDLVTIIGPEENVAAAREHLLNLEDEYVSAFIFTITNTIEIYLIFPNRRFNSIRKFAAARPRGKRAEKLVPQWKARGRQTARW